MIGIRKAAFVFRRTIPKPSFYVILNILSELTVKAVLTYHFIIDLIEVIILYVFAAVAAHRPFT
jgi:hypothetical protein